MKLKRFLSVALVVVMLLTACPAALAAANSCGNNLTWRIEGNTLYINGTGDMKDFGSASAQPWNGQSSDIKAVVISEGVTSIGSYAFDCFFNLQSITLPKSIKSVGVGAFGVTTLSAVYYAGTAADKDNIVIASTNDRLKNATWTCAPEPVNYSITVSSATVEQGDTVTVSISLDNDITVLAGSIDVSAKWGDKSLTISSITPNDVAGCQISAADSRILVVTEGTITAGTKIADVTFSVADNAAMGDYKVGLVCDMYTGSMENGESDKKLDFTVNGGTVKVTENTLRVTWKNDDGTVLEVDSSVKFGVTAVYNKATPTKASTAQYDYIFKGWSPEVGAVTVDTVFTAQYTSILRKYAVKWADTDGTLLDEQILEYGKMPVYSKEEPTKEADLGYTYKFDGWNSEVKTVSGDATYIAIFKEVARSYGITISTDVKNVKIKLMSGNTELLPSDGVYTLAYGTEYSLTANAPGYDSISTAISINIKGGKWTVDSESSSATLNLSGMKKRSGDHDNDGVITITDAQHLYNYILGRYKVDSESGLATNANGKIVFNKNVADLNENGSVGSDDILPLLRLISSQISA